MATTSETKKGFDPKAYYTDAPKSGMSAENLLSFARLSLLQQYPFFGKMAMAMQFVETPLVKTTAVDAQGRFLYNPLWVNAFTPDDAIFEMGHEVMHLYQRLFGRFPLGGIHHFWNLAADYHADCILMESRFRQSFASLLMVGKEEVELVEKYPTVPALYKHLIQEAADDSDCEGCKHALKQLQKIGNDGGAGESGSGHDGHEHSDGPPHTCQNIRQCCGGVATDASKISPQDLQKWTEIVIGAKIHAEGRGQMPAALGEEIGQLTESKVRWQDFVKSFSARIFGRSLYTFKRPSRRGPAMGMRLPSKAPDGFTAISVMDTSGSMSHESVVQSASETLQILKTSGCKRIWLILHDAAVYYSGFIEAADFSKLRTARGGTSHEEVWQCLERRHDNKDFNPPTDCEIKLVIMFTDLGTTFPNYVPDYDVLWAVPVKGLPGMAAPVPFGTKIPVETEE